MSNILDLKPKLEKKRKKDEAARARREANDQILGPKKKLVLHPPAPAAAVKPLISKRDVEFFRLLASLSGKTNPNPAVSSLLVDHGDFEE